MKKMCWLFLLLIATRPLFSQNADSKPVSNKRWPLARYLWGFENYKRSGNPPKPLIDFDAMDRWEELGDDHDVSISPDGEYFCYTTQVEGKKTFFVQSTKNDWKMNLGDVGRGFFSADSKSCFYKKD